MTAPPVTVNPLTTGLPYSTSKVLPDLPLMTRLLYVPPPAVYMVPPEPTVMLSKVPPFVALYTRRYGSSST